MTVHYPPPRPAPESGMGESLHIYVANAMALPKSWQAALLRLQIEGPLYRIGAGRFYGRRSDHQEIMIPEVIARALERHEFVRFGFMGRTPRVPALYATERGKRYGIALATIDTYEKRRVALATAAMGSSPRVLDPPDAVTSCPDENQISSGQAFPGGLRDETCHGSSDHRGE